ncbi:MAG: O-antigen ligase family protein [Proteobacteria bacterium]|nr:O-antigen ligase family protein [Pseudomonadota bacterium]
MMIHQRIKSVKIEGIFAFSAFLLIPFLGGNHLSLYYINIDRFWIETSFVLLVIIAAVVNWLKKKEVQAGFYKFFIFFLPFGIIHLISLIYTWNTFSTLSDINVLIWIIGSVYLFLLSDDKEVLLKALVIGTFISSLCAIVQSKILFPNLMEIFKGGRYAFIVKEQPIPFSSFLYHNILGGYFCFILPIAIYFGIFKKRWLYVAMASGIISGLIFATSRIAIGIALLVVLYSTIALVMNRDIKRFLMLIFIVFIGCAIAFSLLYGSKRDVSQGTGFELEKKMKITRSYVSTLGLRTEIWKNGLNAFLAKPVIGYGPGTFEYAYRKYFDGGLYTRYAHSSLLKIGTELGIIGVLCSLFYIIGLIIHFRVRLKESRYLFIVISIGSGFLFGLVDFAFDIPAFSITFFVLSSLFFEKNIPVAEKTYRILFYLIALLMIVSLFFTVKANLSKKSLENGIIYEENGLLKDAYLSYRDSIKEMPLNSEGYMKIINVLIKSYRNEKDLEEREKIKNAINSYLVRAEEIKDNDSEMFFVEGMGHAFCGNVVKAENSFLKALSYYPSSPYYVYEIARFYFENNELKRAKTLIHSIDSYINKYKSSKNPNGFFMYKIRDLESEIEYKDGNVSNALMIEKKNIHDVKNEEFIISSIKSREFIQKELFIRYLEKRISFYETEFRKR